MAFKHANFLVIGRFDLLKFFMIVLNLLRLNVNSRTRDSLMDVFLNIL